MPKDKAYQQAEQKIQQALQSGATELNLLDMKLTELPGSIGQLTQLTELDLSNNQLTTLPDSLGQLTQLTTLDLSNNQLTLPDWLGKFTQYSNND
ncbi:MAG: leucine-rich repeat domain-containing protein [Anaerolineales bacterium]|nr:leucine-rich repeat domain-containing protein [Anaerolineales bacterium]